MEKSKLGISVSLAAFILFCISFFGGYVPAVLAVGFILFAENSNWLKKVSLKNLFVMFCFSILSLIINLLPNTLEVFVDLFKVWNGDALSEVYLVVLRISVVLEDILYLLKIAVYVLMVILGFAGKMMPTPFDGLLNKHFPED